MGIIRLERLKPQPTMKVAIIVLPSWPLSLLTMLEKNTGPELERITKTALPNVVKLAKIFSKAKKILLTARDNVVFALSVTPLPMPLYPTALVAGMESRPVSILAAVVKRSVKIALVPVLLLTNITKSKRK